VEKRRIQYMIFYIHYKTESLEWGAVRNMYIFIRKEGSEHKSNEEEGEKRRGRN